MNLQKKYLLFSILLSICFTSVAQEFDEQKLIGNIKNVTQNEYNSPILESNGQLPENIQPNHIVISIYDAEGLLIEEIRDSPGNTEWWGYAHKFISYNSKDQEIESKSYQRTGKLSDITSTQYDSAGRNIGFTRNYTSGSRFILDDKGNRIRLDSYDRNGVVTYVANSIFDANNLEIQTTIYDKKILTGSYYYIYNDARLIVESTYYDHISKISGTNYYTYDSHGNIIQIEHELFKKRSITDKYEYEYDINGNWIKKKCFRYYNKLTLVSIVIREIIYY